MKNNNEQASINLTWNKPSLFPGRPSHASSAAARSADPTALTGAQSPAGLPRLSRALSGGCTSDPPRPRDRDPAPRSPVGMPSSLEPLPKPFTTSPRQKYGRCRMAAGERRRPLGQARDGGASRPQLPATEKQLCWRAALPTASLWALPKSGEKSSGAFRFSIYIPL